MRRRELLRLAAAAGLAGPAAALGRSPAAAAQTTGAEAAGGGDVAVLLGLLTLEHHAAFAYRAAGHGLPAHDEHAHAVAVAAALQAFAAPTPPGPGSAAQLAPAAAAVAKATSRRGALRAAERLELDLLSAYGHAVRALAEPSLLRTAGSILAVHEKHLMMIRLAAGDEPLPVA